MGWQLDIALCQGLFDIWLPLFLLRPVCLCLTEHVTEVLVCCQNLGAVLQKGAVQGQLAWQGNTSLRHQENLVEISPSGQLIWGLWSCSQGCAQDQWGSWVESRAYQSMGPTISIPKPHCWAWGIAAHSRRISGLLLSFELGVQGVPIKNLEAVGQPVHPSGNGPEFKSKVYSIPVLLSEIEKSITQTLPHHWDNKDIPECPLGVDWQLQYWASI